ncbi:hypothetical protein PV08_07662 [Exophiala spinifera]|uniref:Nickel/cobalt efflux system n=1 Tax=Exophiala spinifera TaxID=91928 RepID=A0A0D1ZPY5_9EURO|nr:uncharacterized protein PV08_07662 [Exophiala spinifera]KIW14877.1 hypothetical protein PV08_07662 [Exophiala spinifera]
MDGRNSFENDATVQRPAATPTPAPAPAPARKKVLKRTIHRIHKRLSHVHSRIPYLRSLPLAAILIIALLILVNLVIWAICGLILTSHTHLLSTAALAYTLGLRHALDADHISAIDLMTRRLIATGQRPVTVGTFFSLGHSTIVVVTSIVVAATAAGVSSRFGSFSTVGGIIGTSVSAAFLILLGVMNAYILYKLIVQMRKIIRLQPGTHEAAEAWNVEGGGCLFRTLKKAFKLINRPWKMYPLGVLFGLGFDTSSEIALLGISSIQGSSGTSLWLILVFPVLFTAGMCLVDTIDGALMMSLYVAPMGMGGSGGDDDKKDRDDVDEVDQVGMVSEGPLAVRGGGSEQDDDVEQQRQQQQQQDAHGNKHSKRNGDVAIRVKNPLTFLYYSIVLTTLTVICAVIIGVIQLLTLILNVAEPTGRFWDGVETAGDNYEIIGGAICGSFVLFGGLSVLCYRPWTRWVDRQRSKLREADGGAAATPAHGHGHGDGDGDGHGHQRTTPFTTAAGGSTEFIGYTDDENPRADTGLKHGQAEELVEVQGKAKSHRVTVKAHSIDDYDDGTPTRSGPSGGNTRIKK